MKHKWRFCRLRASDWLVLKRIMRTPLVGWSADSRWPDHQLMNAHTPTHTPIACAHASQSGCVCARMCVCGCEHRTAKYTVQSTVKFDCLSCHFSQRLCVRVCLVAPWTKTLTDERIEQFCTHFLVVRRLDNFSRELCSPFVCQFRAWNDRWHEGDHNRLLSSWQLGKITAGVKILFVCIQQHRLW